MHRPRAPGAREAVLCFATAALAIVAWPLADAIASATMLARHGAAIAGASAYACWRGLVAGADGLLQALATRARTRPSGGKPG